MCAYVCCRRRDSEVEIIKSRVKSVEENRAKCFRNVLRILESYSFGALRVNKYVSLTARRRAFQFDFNSYIYDDESTVYNRSYTRAVAFE